MMRKLLFFILLYVPFLGASNYTVESLSGESIYIGETDEPVGSTGIIVHPYGDEHKAILGRVEVVRTGKRTAVQMIDFKDLTQDALPSIARKPQKGDVVHMGWLYGRALLIAPGLNSYNEITKADTKTSYVHPDLFAAHLSLEGHPSPLKRDFQSFCIAYDVGLLKFYIDSTLYTVDCSTFSVLETVPLTIATQETKLPFYSRIQEIDANWWGEGSDAVAAFDPYYVKLLGISHE